MLPEWLTAELNVIERCFASTVPVSLSATLDSLADRVESELAFSDSAALHLRVAARILLHDGDTVRARDHYRVAVAALARVGPA
jgi:hypothetical protein